MNCVSTYIRQSLQNHYPSQELRSLTMMICCDILGFEAMDVYMGKDINLSESKQLELENILTRMQKNEPIQYVLGKATFCELTFEVAPGVLIPRPETAELVERIVKENPGSPRIVDMGTGSGCIAIALSHKLPLAEVVAWDISDDALAIARRNNRALHTQVVFVKQSILEAHPDALPSYDVLVSNPPYIAESEKEEMDAHVLNWEPSLALFVPDDDPLLFYRNIARLGLVLLKKGGRIYLEINQAYGKETAQLLEEAGYQHVTLVKDQFNNNRFVTAYR